MVVACRGYAHAQQIGMLVNGSHQTRQEHQELQVVLRVRSWLQKVAAVSRNRPVVVLARTVHILEGLLVLQTRQTVIGGKQLEFFHGEQIVIDSK